MDFPTRCYSCGTTHEVEPRADGQLTCPSCINCFYGMTKRNGTYLSRGEVRAILMRELRRWGGTTAERAAVADVLMGPAGGHVARRQSGCICVSWASDVAAQAMVLGVGSVC